MSARELTLISISSALIGALTSIVVLRLVSSNKSSGNNSKKNDSPPSLRNGNGCGNASASKCDPFDPSKRRGFLVSYFRSLSSIVFCINQIRTLAPQMVKVCSISTKVLSFVIKKLKRCFL